MPTAAEHMAADMAYALSAAGDFVQTRTVDGRAVLSILEDVEDSPAQTAGGVLASRMRLWVLAADLSYLPVPEQVMVIDGLSLTVESVNHSDSVLELVLSRYWS